MIALIPEKYKNDGKILNRVIQQLKKDAQMVQMSYAQWENATSLEDFYQSVTLQVAFLIENDFDLLTRLFYRVDVNESAMKAKLHMINGEDASEVLTDAILEREFQKVIFKMEFSGELKEK